MIELDKIANVYFIGIGGIGMSALARFFHLKGKLVAGYDLTPSMLTGELESEGIEVCFRDELELIPQSFKKKEETLVVYTPAIPSDHKGLNYFKEQGFKLYKRAEILGILSRQFEAICVAGTHGKTTISSLTAHLFAQSSLGCNAFLGGIANNYNTNFLQHDTSPYVVLEADEFDRSFLHLHPFLALISAMDADHLDIYGDKESVSQAFKAFANQIQPGGVLVIKEGLQWDELSDEVELLTYSLEPDADFYPINIKLKDGLYRFDLKSPFGTIKGLTLGMPGLLNVENSIGAMALALLAGVEEDEIRAALATFSGIRRRFDYKIRSEQIVYIDDYAHHPEEIRATLKSVKAMYPQKKVTVVFQPHLFSRTKDFASEFAASLDLADRVWLLPIYPAREKPMVGVTSELIAKNLHSDKCTIVEKSKVVKDLLQEPVEVVLTLGAGDIDRLVPDFEQELKALISN